MTDAVDAVVDTSVAVPALLSGHANHALARAFVDDRSPAIAAHALVESLSVLTRLPGMRISVVDAARLLERSFPAVAQPGLQGYDLVAALAAGGITGGAIYDGLVALAARAVGGELFSLDARASSTYQGLGVPFRLLGA